MNYKKIILNRLLCVIFLFPATLYAQINTFTNNQPATLIVGQPNFTSNETAYSQYAIPLSSASAISSTGMLAVVSQINGRILLWDTIPTTNGAPASIILGKPNFEGSEVGCTQSLTNSCKGVAFSPDGKKLLVSDGSNNRVLIWNTIPTTNGAPADVVIGQTNFTDTLPGCTENKMKFPWGIFVNNDGKLFINDSYNHRVLIYNTIPTTNGAPADVVIGKPDFSTSSFGNAANQMGLSYYSTVSPDGKLLISDRGNNRILIYDSIPTMNNAAADVVIGQDDFGYSISGLANNKFDIPIGVTVAPSGMLAVGDFNNNRVLIFNQVPTTNGAAADIVLGQPDFTTKTGGVSETMMLTPYGINFDLNGRLFVNGRDMNRVMVFGNIPNKKAELELIFTGDNTNACGGSILQYDVIIKNNGPDTATNIIVQTNIPVGFTSLISTITNIGIFNNNSGFWDIPKLSNGEIATLSFNSIIDTSVITTFYAQIASSNQQDTIMYNNASSISISSFNKYAPIITNDPDDFFACEGDTAFFACQASGAGTLNYQWQNKTVDGLFIDIVDDSIFSGSQTDTLIITDVNQLLIGNKFRCNIFSDLPCFTTTLNAMLLHHPDTISPTITCPSEIIRNTDSATCTTTITNILPIYNDNCSVNKLIWELSGATIALSNNSGINDASGTSFNAGETMVKYIVEDAMGNIASDSFIVTVIDNEKPIITIPENKDVILSGSDTLYLISDNEMDVITAYDNCSFVTITNNINDSTSLNGTYLGFGSHYITWTGTDNNGNSDSKSLTLNISKYSNIEPIKNRSVKLYPNPVINNEIIVSTGSNIQDALISVVSLTGEKIITQKQTGNANVLNIKSLPSATYFITITTKTNIYTKKFIKQ
ncbi:MAG: T9SS type A sorting domain-containing protein [Marinilabiliaceae bacterium]|nr:T9SS type A sorting domain-containing protein [Marinilabiliaceae bacterium]